MTPADVDGTSDDYSLRIPPSLNRAALAVAMSRCQQSSPPFYRYLPMLRYHTRWKSLTAEDFTWFFQDHATTGKGYGPLQTVEEFPVPILEGEPGKRPSIPRLRNIFKLIALCRKGCAAGVRGDAMRQAGPSTVLLRGAHLRKTVCPFWITTRPVGGISALTMQQTWADHAHVNTAARKNQHGSGGLSGGLRYARPKRGDAAYAAWDEATRMEHQDAQNITLRFCWTRRIFPPAGCRIRTWQRSSRHSGRRHGSGSLRSRAQCFRQWGWTRCRWNKSGMQAYSVVDGGKVVYQKTGPKYTLSWAGM